jgi:CHAD domain-containing protein
VASRRKDALQVGKLFPKIDSDCIDVISKITKESAQKLRLNLWIGPIFARKAKKLDSQLKSVKSIDDEKKIHKARLSAKALRYLAESFVSESFQAQQLVDDLHDLQDVIGSLRDIHTLIARVKDLPKLSLPGPVLKRIRHREKVLFKKFEKDYMKAPGFQNKAQLLFASIVQTS